MTPRGDPKRPKIAPKRPQDDLEEVFFSHRFLCSILVGFGFDFGSFGAPFWEPKSVILGIDFGMVFGIFCISSQDRPKSGQEAPKRRPRPPKSGPRGPKSGPREAKSGLRGPQERPRAAKSDPRGPQDARKESEKVTRAVQAKQAAEKRAKR